jgi:hypothetical protein
VADAVLEKEYVTLYIPRDCAPLIHFHRKDKPIPQTFGGAFSWDDAIDAAADVYNGVC